MPLNRIFTPLGRLLAAWIAVSGLIAAEHHGTVKFGGLPVPGASVTVTKGDKKLVTTSDENGRYAFADLSDGTWKLDIEMLGFAKLSKEIGIAFDAPAAEWTLSFLPLNAIMAPPAAAATPAPAAPPAAATAPAATTAAATDKPAAAKPAAATTPTTPATAAAPATGRGGAGRGTQGGGRGQQGANGGRPSLLAAAGGFTRVDVNNTAGDAGLASPDTSLGSGEMADMSSSADPALLVNGSVSRGLDTPQQNDWGGGRGGDGFGMGPGGMGMGMGGQDGAGGGGMAMGGGGMPGGGGGMPGGRGGGGGGMPGGFGGGGGRGGGGAPGGRGGRGGGPPGGRAGVASFGNGRRNRAMQYNGNASFTLDNSVWDARSFSINGQETAKPGYAKARASLMFGGPLKIPHLLSGTKGTFTINYQLARQRNGTTSTTTMPTLLERGGDFSQSVGSQGLVTIYDPLTGNPFPNNLIPSTRINPVAAGLLKYYPNPNAPGYKNNYQAPITTIANSDNINSRLNQTLNAKNRINGGMGYQGNNSTTPNIYNFIDHGSARNITANVAWGHNFTNKLINNLRYNFSRARNTALPFFANTTNIEAALGITGTLQSPQNWGPPTLSFTNYSGLSDGANSLTRNQTSSVGDSLIFVRGVHNFTFGADYRRQQINRTSDPNARGQYTFTGLGTANVVNGVATPATGFDFADFLLGRADTTSLRYNKVSDSLYFRTHAYDVYMTDDWRINPKISLNFGLRWDYASPISELNNLMANLDIAPGYASATPLLPGQSGTFSGSVPNSLVRPDKKDISPRVGFAWRPISKGTMVVRGGYGTYYNTSVYNNISNNLAQQPPAAQSFTLATTSLPSNLSMGQYFTYLAGQNQLTNTFAVDPNYKTGYAQMWQIAVQNDLGKSLAGTLTYNGTKGTRLDQTLLPNSAPSGGKANGLQSGYIFEQSNGNSIYHGVSAQIQRRMRSGVGFSVVYTHSKAIDNAVQAQNYLSTAAERALSSSSRPNTVNANWQYSSGQGRTGAALINGWKGALLKDWTYTNNINFGSGLPLTPTVGGVSSTTTGTGITGSLRANATGQSINNAPAGQSFNYAAFALPAAGQWGNAGRDTIQGPMQFSLNGSLQRTFRVAERKSINFRFDANNMLNHVTFTRFNTTIGSNSLGLLSNPGGMRSMTATLRFSF